MARLNDTEAVQNMGNGLEHKCVWKEGKDGGLPTPSFRPSANPNDGMAQTYRGPRKEPDCGTSVLRSATMLLGNKLGEKK